MPEQIPIWRNEGIEPPESLKDSGWEPGMKPSAQHMNWLFNQLAVLAANAGTTVEDLLTSTSIENALSANQGRVLNNNLITLDNKVTTHLDDDVAHNRYGVATGTNALVVTLSPAPTALIAGMSLRFKNTTANTGAVTLNINGLGAKPIVKNGGTALSSGNLKAGGVYTVAYDDTNFILQGEGGGAVIKSVQRGYAVIPSTGTSVDMSLNPVDRSKTIVNISYETRADRGGAVLPRAQLTADNVLTIDRGLSDTYNVTVVFEVIEFENVKVQSGTTIIYNGASTSSPSINTVDLAKSILFFSYTSQYSGSSYGQYIVRGELKKGDISFARWGTNDTATISYFVLELI